MRAHAWPGPSSRPSRSPSAGAAGSRSAAHGDRATPRSTPAGSSASCATSSSTRVEHGEGRPVEIAVAVNESAVAVTVRDHGVGLRPGEAALVFNRFWRADPARARTTGGTGLGLAISLEDARLHDGWLQAWGEPGEGSCFRLTLPRRAGLPIVESPLPLRPDDLAVDARRRRPRTPRPVVGSGPSRASARHTPPAPGRPR